MQILLILVALAQAAGMVAVFIRNYRRVPTGIYDDGTDNTYTSQADDNDSAVFRSAAPVHTNLAETGSNTVEPTVIGDSTTNTDSTAAGGGTARDHSAARSGETVRRSLRTRDSRSTRPHRRANRRNY